MDSTKVQDASHLHHIFREMMNSPKFSNDEIEIVYEIYNKFHTMTSQIDDQELQLLYLDNENKNLKHVNKTRTEIYDKLEIENRDLVQTNEKLKYDFVQADQNVKKMTQTIQNLERRNIELEETVANLMKGTQANVIISSRSCIHDIYDDDDITNLCNEIDTWKERLDNTESKLNHEKKLNIEINESLNQLKSENNTLNEKIKEIINYQTEQKEIYEVKIQKLENEKQQLEKQLEDTVCNSMYVTSNSFLDDEIFERSMLPTFECDGKPSDFSLAQYSNPLTPLKTKRLSLFDEIRSASAIMPSTIISIERESFKPEVSTASIAIQTENNFICTVSKVEKADKSDDSNTSDADTKKDLLKEFFRTLKKNLSKKRKPKSITSVFNDKYVVQTDNFVLECLDPKLSGHKKEIVAEMKKLRADDRDQTETIELGTLGRKFATLKRNNKHKQRKESCIVL